MSKTLMALIAALAASPAFAQSIFDPMPTAPHNYVGVSGGQATFRTDCSDLGFSRTESPGCQGG